MESPRFPPRYFFLSFLIVPFFGWKRTFFLVLLLWRLLFCFGLLASRRALDGGPRQTIGRIRDGQLSPLERILVRLSAHRRGGAGVLLN